MSTITHYVGTESLTVKHCWCGCWFAVPTSLWNSHILAVEQGQSPRAIFCPIGHECIWQGQNELAKAEAALQRERAALDQEQAARRSAEAKAVRVQATLLRLRKRVKNGICPCCHRTVKQLAAHMANKHPEYTA